MRGVRCIPVLVLLGAVLAGSAAPAQAQGERDTLRILFTHDTHDHWYPTQAEGGAYGGYTRLATLLRQEREAFPSGEGQALVTLDAGDFSMGSLLQTIYSTDAPELRALGEMRYDATTFGNHEFDYRAGGLAAMLNAAVESGETLPAIVEANYRPPESDTESWAAWENYGVTDYTVIERGRSADGDPLRIAVFGVMGEEADSNAPMSGMEFEPAAQAAQRVVQEIQAREEADFIVCLSHSGTDNGKGEDYELARKVDGIDVILSGHTHTTLEEPIRVGDTLIVSCGADTANLGRLTVERNENGGLELVDYTLLPVDETVPEDPEMVAMAEVFQRKVEEGYLRDYGLGYDQVLAQNPWSFPAIQTFGEAQQEEPLGNLIADSYLYAVKKAEGADYVPVDFAVVAEGVIRSSFTPGPITTADAFQVSSLGIGADGTPGYPLISAYLYGHELKDAFEVDASVTPLMPEAQLYGAGMGWSLNPHRLIFNKVTDCWQVLEDGTRVPIEDDRLYRVVTGLYCGQMLGTVNGQSFGILGITPRDENGAPVEDLEARIIHNASGAEVKEWYALASYLRSMGTVDERYAAPDGRKQVIPSWNPVDLLRSPNQVGLTVYGVVLGLVILVLLVVSSGGRRKRRAYGKGRGRGNGYRPYRG